MEQVAGIEPASQPWQGRIITVILYLHGISIAISGPARLSLLLFMSANGTNYGEWCAMTGSNRRPDACKAPALPTELIAHECFGKDLTFISGFLFPSVLPPPKQNCLRPKAFHSLLDVLLLTAASFLPMASRATSHRKAVLELPSRFELLTSSLPMTCSAN